ncbi:9455_t:CDS:2 [Acaulospora colombiana]|uniref:9455_t:CDS:1 n=1 Tax=Acaulospora colombiana TaxID=27376 RepID=A0ACA9KQL1_9GLOM|nr:9455_t:CDS:2 [Acaulospora colombiana]
MNDSSLVPSLPLLPPSDGSSPAPTSTSKESIKSPIVSSPDKPDLPDDSAKLSQTQKMLQQLLKDPLLSDLAKLNEEGNISVEEVDTLIALETGTAFEIRVEREGLEPIEKRDQ